MADIRCPNCGKSNPADRKTCQYCQAVLNPPVSPQPFADEPLGEPGGQEEEIPDWLKGLRGFEDSKSEPAAKSEAAPTWFQESAFSETGGAQAGDEGEAPDWLSRLGGQDEPEAEPGPETAQPAAESLPDWLSGTKEASVPDWFPTESQESSGSFEKPFADEPQETLQPAQESDFPDWLTQLKNNQDLGEAPQAEQNEPAKEETPASPFQSNLDMPDWLSNLSAQEQPPEEPAAKEAPDWLRSMGDLSVPQLSASATPAFDESGLSGVGEEEVLPDWLKRLETNSSDTLASGVPALILGDETPQPFSSSSGMGALPEAGDLASEPDWLSQVSAEPEAQTQTSKAQEAEPESNLAKATLPGWLEAMRPMGSVETAAPYVDTTDDRVEGAGPLAGLRGVLSAEPDVAQVRKPASYSIKLQVPTEQQGRLEILQKLVETETDVKPLPTPAAVSISSIMRLVLFIILILAVIWALSGSPMMPTPGIQSAPSEITNFHAVVQALPANAQVLLAFDYEPGFSGELEASISAVLNHLDQKGASLVLVSTNTNGPNLAERMVQQLNSQADRSARPPVSAINLGYIPGGTTGLLAFANKPSDIMRFDLKTGQSPWNGNPLQFTDEINNFNLVVVITENPDTARAWIEQVGTVLQKALNPIPLLMIVSGQAEPMVYPYFMGSSHQVVGILSGLRAGAIYEDLIGRSGAARQYWDAYSLTILASVLLIVIGVCASGILNVLAQYKRNKKVEGTA